MAPAGYKLISLDHLVDRHDRNEDDCATQDIYIRTRSDTTSPSVRASWSFDDGRHQAEPALNSSAHVYEPVRPGDGLPPYAVNDSTKDESNTAELDVDCNRSSKTNSYVPFSLQTWVLSAFALVFAATLGALEVMHQISSRNQGLSTTDPSKHYLWTYGPTMFLSIVAPLWGRVEYRVKQLTPWEAMTRNPIPADKGFLMDYVSIWNVNALLTWLRAKHYVVSVAIVGSLLLKLALIASTALLSLEPRRIFHTHEMQLNDVFTSFSGDIDQLFLTPELITTVGVARHNLSYPPGTGASFAVQSFQPIDDITDPSSLIVADVNVFSADLACEDATVTSLSDAQYETYVQGCAMCSYSLTVSSKTCTMNNVSNIRAHNASETSQAEYYGAVSAGKCIGQPNNTDVRRYTMIVEHKNPNDSRSIALICRPIYRRCRSPVTLFMNGSIQTVVPPIETCSSIAEVSGWDFGHGVMNSLNSTSDCNIERRDLYEIDPFFRAMLSTSATYNFTNYMDIDHLITEVNRLFSAIAAQIAKFHLTRPTTKQTPGKVGTNHQRLLVRTIPLRIMEGTLALLIAISLIVILTRPSPSMSSVISALGGVATILASSPRIAPALQGLDGINKSHLSSWLTGKKCHAVVDTQSDIPTYRLETTADDDLTEDTTCKSGQTDWWQPLSMTIYARIGIALLPIAVIAALEESGERNSRDESERLRANSESDGAGQEEQRN